MIGYPERLEKIEKFILVTGYSDIYNKYMDYLRITCSDLYDEVGYLIKEKCQTYKNIDISNAKNNKNKSIINTTTIQKFCSPVDKNKLNKSDIFDICRKNNYNIPDNFTFASRNKTGRVYWANPNKIFLTQDWHLVLNDNKNKILYFFFIPYNSILESQVRYKTDKLIDLQIYCDNSKFIDSRSGLSFAKWLVKSINY